jgi:hypothetical protein
MRAIAIVAFAFVRLRRTETATVERPTWRSALDGVRFVRSQPVLLGAISLDLFAVLFGGASALLPVYATDILHVGAFGFGMLRSAGAVGAFVMGLVLHRRPPVRPAMASRRSRSLSHATCGRRSSRSPSRARST